MSPQEPVHTGIVLESGQSAQSLLYWRAELNAYEDDSERQAQVHFEDQWIDAPFACHDNRSDSPIDLVEQGDIEIE